MMKTLKHSVPVFLFALILLTCAFVISSAAAAAAALVQAPPFDLPVGGNFVLAVGVVGFLMSPIISFLNRRNWSAEGKAVGAFFWCLLASVLLFAAGDRFDMGQREPSVLFGTFLAIFMMATGLYQFYWKPSGIGPAIEARTG